MKSTKTFFQTIMFPVKDNESIVETRSQMYKKQKQKSSSNLIPNQSSLLEHLKRNKLQTIIWKNFANIILYAQILLIMV